MHRDGSRATAGQHGPASSAIAAPGYALRAETGPDDFLKFPQARRPVTIWQAIKVPNGQLLLEILNVSEQKAEQTSGGGGSLRAGPTVPHSPKALSEPVAASAQESAKESSDVGSPTLV